jgi:DNA mismatch repair protein MSH5
MSATDFVWPTPPLRLWSHSNLLSTHEIGQLLDEEMTQEEIQDLKDAQDVFRRFLAWDIHKEMEQTEIQSGTVKEKLAAVLGRT